MSEMLEKRANDIESGQDINDQKERTAWDDLAEDTEFAGEEPQDVAELRSELEETESVYEEVLYAHDLAPKVKEFCRSFGIDTLARRYGLGRVMEVVTKHAVLARNKSVVGRDNAELGADAISAIYEEIEPDADKRKALFSEASTSESSDGQTTTEPMATKLRADENGKIRIAESDEMSKENAAQAWYGLAAMHSLGRLISGKQVPKTRMFGDVKESIGDGKDTWTGAGQASEKMTEKYDNPGISELVDEVEERADDGFKEMTQHVESAREKILDISAEIEAKHPGASPTEVLAEVEDYLASHGAEGSVGDVELYSKHIRTMQEKWGKPTLSGKEA